MYLYLKALHIIFVVAWFAGMFYMPRLFIYNTEAGDKEDAVKNALREQFKIMMKRLWFGITWPSAIITLILGPSLLFSADFNWYTIIFQPEGLWLLLKLIFVLFLYLYHFSLHAIYKQQLNGVFKYTSQQLRVWNEVALIFLVSVVMLVTVKQTMSFVWGLIGLIAFIIVLVSAIKIYKVMRK